MKWAEIKVETASEAVEAISNIMMEVGASGVAIEDVLDIENFQKDNYGELIDKAQVTSIEEGALVMAYFPETTFLPEILPFIKESIAKLPSFGLAIGKNQLTISEVLEEDWATAWKKYYHPVRITRFLTIVPSWENYHIQSENEQIIRLDPGMAFGTGTHPTTQLTLQAMEAHLRGGETLIDVGTGSGVLSIAGKYLGAKKIYAYDLDEVAVTAAKENIQLNHLEKDIEITTNNLLTDISIQAEMIVANILADIIVLMLKDAWNLLKTNGTLIISGIIEDKKEMILAEIRETEFVIDQILQQNDWYAFVLKKVEEE
ncbi:50S ribosomal protein L11 methyltransferase [Melissococcus plutonius]|uniref:Ribosomal protein L11 methyltransferase n=1 Tax=Melissococcus plutonius TaxID=33970 RepID=A0A2Z5Y1L9_9ENTE|nr:50S ribosomal protein L11 methyltransferase [Melissococcus plutonius]BAL61847.1 ribosomal protein L11 methyltransferase [Melissococcus plutonius DAT561]MCV2499335.1 50S ribosomal protein L11 methyltransferase [Melissococcus plutonius]MCV2501758.1 50S ribosomal protein L11 methyltransferase [Melissococcus plutonius]MCV2505594.1 50S ribosomal protein L11 methyltransferase [Melissococcus plutonius]MCV2507901.1 50S ribosomal protein L11 methyltransferase [Melissococcus plutonius]